MSELVTECPVACESTVRCVSGLAGGGRGAGCAFAGQQFLHHAAGIAQARGELLTAAVLLDQAHLVGAELASLVDVRHGPHEGAQDQLRVVLQQASWRVKSINTTRIKPSQC